MIRYTIGDASQAPRVSEVLVIEGTGEERLEGEERTIKVKGLSTEDLQTLSKLHQSKVITLLRVFPDDSGEPLGFGKILDVQKERIDADGQVLAIRIKVLLMTQFRQIISSQN